MIENLILKVMTFVLICIMFLLLGIVIGIEIKWEKDNWFLFDKEKPKSWRKND